MKTMVEFCGVENIKAKFPGYKQGNYLGNLLNKFEWLFFSEYMETNSDWDLAIENFCGKHSIPIMTIHKSKGLEYSAVYFIGLEDSAFWNFRNRSEEERCAFFVAISRAKEAITFTFCKQRTGTKYPIQQHKVINEFFELLQMPGGCRGKKHILCNDLIHAPLLQTACDRCWGLHLFIKRKCELSKQVAFFLWASLPLVAPPFGD